MNKKKTVYDKVIAGLPRVWMVLKKHAHKNTEGIDKQSINTFSKKKDEYLTKIKKDLEAGSYQFTEMRRAKVNQKTKPREILISTISDRIVSKAILDVIYPNFEMYTSNCDYSKKVNYQYKKGQKELKGVPLAALAIQQYIRDGYCWIVEADIKKFFDHVPKKEILKIVRKEIKDKKLNGLIKQIIEFKAADDAEKVEKRKEYHPRKGIAQGSSISPLLASIYLYKFDMFITAGYDVKLVRYVDDFIILCKDENTAKGMYTLSKNMLHSMGLEIHELNVADNGKIKTKITHTPTGPFDFLGLCFNNVDIDISRDKKEEINNEVLDILHKSGGRIYRKTSDIEKKLRSFIKQYRHSHYTRTKQSLTALTKRIQEKIEASYLNEIKSVLGDGIYKKLNDIQIARLLKILDIPIKNLVD
jgi:RNA-directed DNA polymerase